MSDHRMISLCIKVDQVEEEPRRHPRKTDWETFDKELESLLRESQEEITGPVTLETEAENLSSVIFKAFQEACPLKSKPHKAVRWWNEGLDVLRKTARKAYNEAFRRRTQGELWDNFKEARRKFKKEIRNCKRTSWRDFCKGIESLPEATRLVKILSTEGNDRALGSMRKMDGTWTLSGEDTLKYLLQIHFPGEGTDVEETSNGGSVRETDWDLATRLVTKESIRWAVHKFEPFKAAGPDGLFPALLQKGLARLTSRIESLFRGSIALGVVPEVWKAARVVFIPKPGKTDYTQAKSFRPISLTSFMLKTLERIIDKYLIEEILPNKPLHDNQHAYLKGKSTETALHAATARIEEAMQKGDYTLALFFDVEGAFDKAKTRNIEEELLLRNTPRNIIEWIMSSLKKRKVASAMGDTKVTIRVTGGCPQGSCLSPHLWCLVMDGLLRRLTKEDFYVQAYADDGLVLIRGKFLETCCERMQLACRIIEGWCKDVGLSVNPTKTELMVFTKKRNMVGFKGPKIFGKELGLVKEVKYLGVTFDPKLTWKPHIDKVTDKAAMMFWQLRRAVGQSWGLSPKVLKWLYTQAIRPRIQYGSLIWWPRVRVASSAKSLNRIQRLACRGITGAMRTTPTAALEALVGIPPIKIWIQGEAIASFVRLRDNGQWKGKGSRIGHMEIEGIAEAKIPLTAIRLSGREQQLNLNRKYKVEIPSRDRWEQGQIKFSKETLVAYTDGSKNETGMAGAGLYLEESGTQESFPLGMLTTVFQAEIYAILEVARLPKVVGAKRKAIAICSDSQAALQALCMPSATSALVKECQETLERLAESKEVTLLWVPGHRGIPGNEKADEVAKKGASTSFCGPEPAVDWSKGQRKSAIRNWIWKEAEKMWMETEGCRQAKMMLPKLNKRKTRWLIGLCRTNLKILVDVLTGHCRLKRHLALLKIEDDPICPVCGEEEETAYHYVGECEGYGRMRFHTLGRGRIGEEELATLKWQDILSFIIQTKRFEGEEEVVV